jgi:uncharacterized protein (TIGR03435 family)
MRIELALVFAFGAAAIAQKPGPRPRFEVASVKLSSGCNGGGSMPAHGRFNMECQTLEGLIEMAYAWLSSGDRLTPRLIEISSAPDWIHTDNYQVAAKAEGDASFAQMGGPMLQTLLEERFKLRIHRDKKETPVYFLTVAKGGPKLQATKEGSCVPIDVNHPPAPATQGEPSPVYCGNMGFATAQSIATMTAQGISLDMLAGMALPHLIGRGTTIIDKTGLAGLFDIKLKFARDPSPGDAGALAAATDLAEASLFTAIREQLGLKLEPGKAAVDILVIDHVERPGEN